jgi:hypothetical protein
MSGPGQLPPADCGNRGNVTQAAACQTRPPGRRQPLSAAAGQSRQSAWRARSSEQA